MGDENCVEDLDQEGYRSLEKMLQGSVRYSIWARVLPTLGPLMASRTSSGLVNLGLLAGVRKYDLSVTSTISVRAVTEESATG